MKNDARAERGLRRPKRRGRKGRMYWPASPPEAITRPEPVAPVSTVTIAPSIQITPPAVEPPRRVRLTITFNVQNLATLRPVVEKYIAYFEAKAAKLSALEVCLSFLNSALLKRRSASTRSEIVHVWGATQDDLGAHAFMEQMEPFFRDLIKDQGSKTHLRLESESNTTQRRSIYDYSLSSDGGLMIAYTPVEPFRPEVESLSTPEE